MSLTSTNSRTLWVFGDSWSIPWERAIADGHRLLSKWMLELFKRETYDRSHI